MYEIKNKITYVALLRGINVGGNSIIKMKDLGELFEKLGFSRVQTYIQSGNVIFQTDEKNSRKLEEKIEKGVKRRFKCVSKVVIRTYNEMKQIVTNIPRSWETGSDMKYNVLFLRHTVDTPKILEGLNPKQGIETVVYKKGVLFWSAKTSDLSRTAMIKLSSKKVYQEVTVRNLNTTRKILELMEK